MNLDWIEALSGGIFILFTIAYISVLLWIIIDILYEHIPALSNLKQARKEFLRHFNMKGDRTRLEMFFASIMFTFIHPFRSMNSKKEVNEACDKLIDEKMPYLLSLYDLHGMVEGAIRYLEELGGVKNATAKEVNNQMTHIHLIMSSLEAYRKQGVEVTKADAKAISDLALAYIQDCTQRMSDLGYDISKQKAELDKLQLIQRFL